MRSGRSPGGRRLHRQMCSQSQRARRSRTDRLVWSSVVGSVDFPRMQRRILIVVTVVFVSLALGVFAYTVKAARDNPIPKDARDLDCDGSVSAFEWYTAGLNYGW